MSIESENVIALVLAGVLVLGVFLCAYTLFGYLIHILGGLP